MFKAEAKLLRSVLGDVVQNVHNIGSTSIPGMRAKPIIDILMEVRDIVRMEDLTPEIVEIGYEARGEFGLPGRRYFVKGGDLTRFVGRTHHVHSYETGNPGIERHLVFRDYMISHPEDAATYAHLKEELARKFPGDIEAYHDGKDAFVEGVERRALFWRRSQA